MAVHTSLSASVIGNFVAPYQLGELHRFSGISDGIENTNYLVTLKKSASANQHCYDDYILTIFETLSAGDVTFYMQLMNSLAHNGLPVPQPIAKPGDDQSLPGINGKPALLLSRLPGSHPLQPTVEQCRAIGRALAQQHALTIGMQYSGQHSLQKMLNDGATLLASQNEHDQQLLKEELQSAQQLLARADLPKGLIHGDLFRDNTLFNGDHLSGLLDYYSATTGPLLLDVAITANDWCNTPDFQLDKQRADALLDGYQAIRTLTSTERVAWPDSLRCGALRFWISRLSNPLRPKDPDEFRQRLINFRNLLI